MARSEAGQPLAMNRAFRFVAENLLVPDHCEWHGAFECTVSRLGHLEFRTSCPACRQEHKARQVREPVAAAKRTSPQAVQRLRVEAGISPRYAGKTLDNFVAEGHEGREKARHDVQRLVEAVRARPESAPNLIFAGRPGTGKSHLACAVVEALTPGRAVRRRKWLEIAREIRDTWRRGSSVSERAVVEQYAALDLLLIDEVGGSAGTELERAQMFDVLDARYENKLPTVLITNLSMEALKREVGERVIDRLRDGGGTWVRFDWDSWRGLM